MIGTAVLALLALGFGCGAVTSSDPALRGLTLFGAIVSAVCAVGWFVDYRKRTRRTP